MSTYNGWHNWETWVVSLWIDNDEGTAELIFDDVETEPEHYQAALVAYIETEQDIFSGSDNGIMNDFLQNAIQSIDFEELAEYYIDKRREADEYEADDE